MQSKIKKLTRIKPFYLVLIALFLAFSTFSLYSISFAKEKDDDDRSKQEQPKIDLPKIENPKVEEPKKDGPKSEGSKEKDDSDKPKQEQPKIDLPKTENPKVEEPKVTRPKDDDNTDKGDKSKPQPYHDPIPVPVDPNSGSAPVFLPQEIETQEIKTNNDTEKDRPKEPKIEEPHGKPDLPKEDKTDKEKPIEPLPATTTGITEPLTTPTTTPKDEDKDSSCEETCTQENEVQTILSEFPVEIPKGSTFVTSINIPNYEYRTILNNKKADKTTSVVLIDSNGTSFDVGHAILPTLNELTSENNRSKRNVGEQSLELTTIVTIPLTASSGEAKLTISSDNKNIASISLKIADVKEVKVSKKQLGKPSIRDPIIAKLVKSGTGNLELKLTISGRNFVGKVAVIDGVLQKLINKASLYFTNITFAPDTGIKLKELQITSTKEIKLTADIKSDITPGVKFFNVITPRGTDIGAIILPYPLAESTLEATTSLDSLTNEVSILLED